MKTITAASLVTGVVFLMLGSACSVGPDQRALDLSAQVPPSWVASDPAEAQDDIASWWRLLDDPELTGLIERAFEGSLDLAEARERVIAARARRGIENADRLLTLDAQASYEYFELGDDGFVVGGAPSGISADTYALGVVAGWELDLWGRVGRLVEAADAEIGFAIEDHRAARVALAAEVAREVILIRALDAERRIVQATIDADTESLEIARARADAGFAGELDVARARRLLDANRAIVPSLVANRREAELRLGVLLGARADTIEVTGTGLPRRDIIPSKGVPMDLLLRRPDLRRAEREVAAATARIGARMAERYPRVSISGSFALQGPDIGDVVNPDASVLSIGPGISVPIFEGGRIESRVLEAESLERQAILRLRRAVLDAVAEVQIADQRRARSEDRVRALNDAQSAAALAEELSLDRYTSGTVDFLDVTEARTQRLAIERDRLLAERDATLRLIDLYAALGGGWIEPVTRDAHASESSRHPSPSSDVPAAPIASTD